MCLIPVHNVALSLCKIYVYILPVIRYFIMSPLFLCPSSHVFTLIMFVYISRFCQIFSVPVLDTPLPRPPIRRPYFCLCYSSVCLLMYIILRCKPYSQYMFLCYLLSSLTLLYQFYYNVIQLTGLRLSFFLIGDPPRPRTVWLVLRSVVPYRSLFFLTPLFCIVSFDSKLAARPGYCLPLL